MEDKGYKLWSEFSGENEEERRVFENFIDNMQSNLLNAKDEHEEAIEREKQWIKQAAEATDAEKAELKGRYDRAMDEYKREENFLYGKKSHFSYYCSTCGRRINTWLFLISSVLAAALFAFLLFKKYLDGEWDELPVFLGWGELVGRRWGLLIEIPVLSFAAAIIILILINITMAVVALIHNKKESERQSFYDAHSAKRDSSKIMVDGLENQIHIKERDFGERKRSADDRIANHEAYIRALDMAMEAIERS